MTFTPQRHRERTRGRHLAIMGCALGMLGGVSVLGGCARTAETGDPNPVAHTTVSIPSPLREDHTEASAHLDEVLQQAVSRGELTEHDREAILKAESLGILDDDCIAMHQVTTTDHTAGDLGDHAQGEQATSAQSGSEQLSIQQAEDPAQGAGTPDDADAKYRQPVSSSDTHTPQHLAAAHQADDSDHDGSNHDGSDGDGAAKQAAQGAEGTGGASTTALNSRVNADSGAAAGATNATHTTGARGTHRTQAIIATSNPGSLAVEVPSAQGR